MTKPSQKIFPIRREYNAWVADETMEDYALRFTPQKARRWSEWQLLNTAMGGLSFLALEAIGATITLAYGFSNAAWAIAVMGIVIFLTAWPISVCAARYGLDMDLLTRGAGFGYLGSTITSLVYATFTFIFFALEAAIMALAVQMALGWPLVVCYVLCALVVIPMVLYGVTFISKLQAWTQPLWALMLLTPYLWLAFTQPQLVHELPGLSGLTSGSADFNWLYFGSASTVIFALIVQVGEQVDYLRFMPRKTAANRGRWWFCVLMGGPGWILMGAARMLGGAYLAYVAAVWLHGGRGLGPHPPLPQRVWQDGPGPGHRPLGHPHLRHHGADQDQCDQCLCRLAGLVQCVLAHHPQPPWPRRVAGVQRDDRDADHDPGRVQRAGEGAGHLQQYRRRLGRRAGGRSGHQQAAGAEPAGNRVPARLPA